MVTVRVVVLVIVVGVLCIEMVEVHCSGMVDILVLGGVFVVEEVELVVGYVLRLVLWCGNGMGYFFCGILG